MDSLRNQRLRTPYFDEILNYQCVDEAVPLGCAN